jgi:fatty acid-binding protein DegV
LVDSVREAAAEGPLHLGICHADCAEEAAQLRATLADVDTVEVLVSEFTPMMGVHTGPGVLATAFWR